MNIGEACEDSKTMLSNELIGDYDKRTERSQEVVVLIRKETRLLNAFSTNSIKK